MPRPEQVPINSDFDLLAELTREEFAVSPARRIELMMSRYQTRPIFGIIENKLLAHSLLHAVRESVVSGQWSFFSSQ